MARAFDLKEVLRSPSGAIHLLAELKRHDWIVSAVDDQNRCLDFPQPGFRVELAANEKAQSGKKPVDFSGNARCGRERRFEHDPTNRRCSTL